MFIPEIIIDGAKVIASGTVVAAAPNTIVFYPLSTSPHYKVEVMFFNIEGSKTEIKVEVVDYFVRVSLTNLEATFGTANMEALYVANENGRKVMLNFATTTIGNGEAARRTFAYTFFDGGPIDV